MSRSKEKRLRRSVIALSIFMAVSSLMGCQTLKRKFTRKKKTDTAAKNFIPVLEPIDYDPQINSSLEEYRLQYSLWQIWTKDLKEAIHGGLNDKKQRYLLTQTLESLARMRQWLTAVKQSELDAISAELREALALFDKPAELRNVVGLKRVLTTHINFIKDHFKPKVVEPYLIQ